VRLVDHHTQCGGKCGLRVLRDRNARAGAALANRHPGSERKLVHLRLWFVFFGFSFREKFMTAAGFGFSNPLPPKWDTVVFVCALVCFCVQRGELAPRESGIHSIRSTPRTRCHPYPPSFHPRQSVKQYVTFLRSVTYCSPKPQNPLQ